MWSLLRRKRPVTEATEAVAVTAPPPCPADYPQQLFAAIPKRSGNCHRVPREATGDPQKDAELLYTGALKWVNDEWDEEFDDDEEEDDWDDEDEDFDDEDY